MAVLEEKRCSKCYVVKPVSDFSGERRRPDGLRCFCKQCGTTLAMEAKKRYFEKNKEKVLLGRRRTTLKKRYGITPEEFDEMLAGQNGACAICETTEPEGRYGVFAVDHDHQTGKVRGILCSKCNSALGQMGDNEEGVLKFLHYLQSSKILVI